MTSSNFRMVALDAQNLQHTDMLFKWWRDSEIQHLIFPRKDEKSIFIPTLEDIREPRAQDDHFMIYDGKTPIGEASLMKNPKHLLDATVDSSWLGLCIGNKIYWGSGAAKFALDFLEERSLNFGFNRIELGVFEYNQRAIRFYEKQGYQAFEKLSKFTYHDGRMWDDIRMEKLLKDPRP